MSFQYLLGSAFPSPDSLNLSDPSNAPVARVSATSLLETFIPGYGPIQKFLLHTAGFDVTILVSLGAVCWICVRVSRFIYGAALSLIYEYFSTDVTINSNDEIHTHLIAFLADLYKVSTSRRLMAETPSRSAWELVGEDADTRLMATDANGATKWFNFSNQEAKAEPLFTPALGNHNFWHKGRYFKLRRKQVFLSEDQSNGSVAYKDREVLMLTTFGRNPEPIKRLLQHAKDEYTRGHQAKTVVKRPAVKEMRRWGGRGSWIKVAERPCRPMSTVVMDDAQKTALLLDINNYLNPASAHWHANRGIPYRRGYLFYGDPGTGKSSLTFALAGFFGLHIHLVSLLEPTLTEEELSGLFTNLPPRCIVLLEDIDSAGLLRDPNLDEDSKIDATDEGKDNELKVADLAKSLKRAKRANDYAEGENRKGISLSGLLNIIDGVASHEGRVLIMTTNHPEKLDDALIRPGRIDHQVQFSNATQVQIKELFERMYTADPPRREPLPSSLTPQKPNLSTVVREDQGYAMINGAAHKSISPSSIITEDTKAIELSTLASDFAVQVPSGMFSPAEIQGFLLRRKEQPRKAVEEVGKWVQGMLERKRTGRKVANVQ